MQLQIRQTQVNIVESNPKDHLFTLIHTLNDHYFNKQRTLRMNKYQPILNVYIIWHPDADALCRPLAKAVYTCLNRDPDKPFARGMGIPAYFRCVSEPGRDQPLTVDINAAVHSVIFVLVEDNLVNADP